MTPICDAAADKQSSVPHFVDRTNLAQKSPKLYEILKSETLSAIASTGSLEATIQREMAKLSDPRYPIILFDYGPETDRLVAGEFQLQNKKLSIIFSYIKKDPTAAATLFDRDIYRMIRAAIGEAGDLISQGRIDADKIEVFAPMFGRAEDDKKLLKELGFKKWGPTRAGDFVDSFTRDIVRGAGTITIVLATIDHFVPFPYAKAMQIFAGLPTVLYWLQRQAWRTYQLRFTVDPL